MTPTLLEESWLVKLCWTHGDCRQRTEIWGHKKLCSQQQKKLGVIYDQILEKIMEVESINDVMFSGDSGDCGDCPKTHVDNWSWSESLLFYSMPSFVETHLKVSQWLFGRLPRVCLIYYAFLIPFFLCWLYILSLSLHILSPCSWLSWILLALCPAGSPDVSQLIVGTFEDLKAFLFQQLPLESLDCSLEDSSESKSIVQQLATSNHNHATCMVGCISIIQSYQLDLGA